MLGPDHLDTATGLNDMALLQRDLREPAVARPLLEHALAIRERVLGPDHPDTATARRNLADLVRRGLGEGPHDATAS